VGKVLGFATYLGKGKKGCGKKGVVRGFINGKGRKRGKKEKGRGKKFSLYRQKRGWRGLGAKGVGGRLRIIPEERMRGKKTFPKKKKVMEKRVENFFKRHLFLF